MKAVLLLLCFAFPRDITGNIFGRHNPNNLVIQKVLYFDEPEQPKGARTYRSQDWQQDAVRPQTYHQSSSQESEERNYQGQRQVYNKDQQLNRQMYNTKMPERTPQTYHKSSSQESEERNYQGPEGQRQAYNKDQQLNRQMYNTKMPERLQESTWYQKQQQLNQMGKDQKMQEHSQESTWYMNQQQINQGIKNQQMTEGSQESTWLQNQKLNQEIKNLKVPTMFNQENQQPMRTKKGNKQTSFNQQKEVQRSLKSFDDEATNEKQYLQSRFAGMTAYPNSLTKTNQMNEPVGEIVEWKGLRMVAGPYSPVQNKMDIQRLFEDAYNTMQPMDEADKMKYHTTFELAAESKNQEAHLNATGLIKMNHYPVEEHIVRTKDGYSLTIFRINKQETTDKPEARRVVFLMHGLLGSADDWLLMGPTHSLAYLLADAGFDVWLGNSRGNKYSRHASKHPAQADFWQYSIDEIALYDLPATIDYILKTSNQEKLYYVGHSQGNTVFFALASTRPEYNDKIAMMFAMSPMVYMNNVRSPLFRMMAPSSPFYQQLNEQLGNGEFRPRKEIVHTMGGALCLEQIGCKKVCSNMYLAMAGVNSDVDASTLQMLMSHMPAGASTRQMQQYGQAVTSGQLRRFDYGREVNQAIYGQDEAPQYEMKQVSAPVALYYSEEDWLAHPLDVARLRTDLANVLEVYKVPAAHFTHVDFQFSNNATEIVYKRIIEAIQNNSTQ